MGNKIDDIEARYILQTQEVDRLRLLLAENSDEYVATRHFLLAAGLDVEHRALQNALKTERWVYVRIVIVRQ